MKLQQLFIAAALLFTLLPACKKYEDGPLISFRTPERRLQGRYHAEVFTINGQDALQLWKDSICSNYFELRYDKSMEKTYIILDSQNNGVGGYYNLIDDKTKIEFSIFIKKNNFDAYPPFKYNSLTTWKLLKLSNKKLHISSNFNGVDYYLELNKFMGPLE